jgi:hypothetical protein
MLLLVWRDAPLGVTAAHTRLLPDHVERNPIEQCVVGNRTSVRRPRSQAFAVVLTGPADVGIGDSSERDLLNAVDFDLGPADAIEPAHLDLGPAPEPERHRDVAAGDVVS